MRNTSSVNPSMMPQSSGVKANKRNQAEISLEQQVDVRPGAFADCLEVATQVAQHVAVDVALGIVGRAEARPPAFRVGVTGSLVAGNGGAGDLL